MSGRGPTLARLDDTGNRIYTWTGRGYSERFYSTTTIIGQGIPKYLVPWASKLVAERAYADVEAHGTDVFAHWAAEGVAYVAAQREAGMKLARIDESAKGLALRYLKGEPDRVRDAAADRGSRVHEEAEDFVLERIRDAARLYAAGEDLPDWPVEISAHMRSFVAWLTAYRPQFLATEATVFNRAETYAGTADAFVECLIGGRPMALCIDYKSGRAIYPEVAIQTASYARGEFIGGSDLITEFPVPAVEGTAVLHLTPKGPVFRRLRYDDAVWRSFLYAREIFRWVVDISKTALGEPIAPDAEDALVASLEGIA